jgi:hypothetical protein
MCIKAIPAGPTAEDGIAALHITGTAANVQSPLEVEVVITLAAIKAEDQPCGIDRIVASTTGQGVVTGSTN